MLQLIKTTTNNTNVYYDLRIAASAEIFVYVDKDDERDVRVVVVNCYSGKVLVEKTAVSLKQAEFFANDFVRTI